MKVSVPDVMNSRATEVMGAVVALERPIVGEEDTSFTTVLCAERKFEEMR